MSKFDQPFAVFKGKATSGRLCTHRRHREKTNWKQTFCHQLCYEHQVKSGEVILLLDIQRLLICVLQFVFILFCVKVHFLSRLKRKQQRTFFFLYSSRLTKLK